jgi:hypothetical protein
MNCYFCVSGPRVGGTHLGVKQAIGACIRCGTGVCQQHGSRNGSAGPLLCLECTALGVQSNTDTAFGRIGHSSPRVSST